MTSRLFVTVFAIALSACAPKSELDAAQKRVSELQAQVATLQSQLTELQSQATTAQAANAQLKEQLEKKPALPVTVSFRKALAGPGYVAIFNTTVKSPVSVLATLKSIALGTSKSFELHLDPSVASERGHLEGIVIEQGDILTMENQNYSPVTVTVNVK